MLDKVNSLLKKKFRIGFMRYFPYRTATLFAKEILGNKRNLICAEIGSFEGDHALFMLETLPNIKTLYLIDPWESYSYYHDNMGDQQKLNNAYNKTLKKLKKYKDKTVIIKKFSHEALKDLPGDLDYIYIDGNHDYKFVKEDMENYYKKLRKGGILGGHDIEKEGVTKAFCEFIAKNKIKNPRIKIMDWMFVKE